MKQMLINVFCPAASKSYDFWIPEKMKVEAAIALLCDDISAFENNAGLFAGRDSLLLYSYLEQKTLPREQTLAETGVKSGDRIALV